MLLRNVFLNKMFIKIISVMIGTFDVKSNVKDTFEFAVPLTPLLLILPPGGITRVVEVEKFIVYPVFVW